MLALPRSTIEEKFANSSLYISSFELTHQELFRAILVADASKESDWTINYQSYDDIIADGRRKLGSGDRSGMIDLFNGSMFTPGLGGAYSSRLHNGLLDLPQEDLTQTIRAVLQKV